MNYIIKSLGYILGYTSEDSEDLEKCCNFPLQVECRDRETGEYFTKCRCDLPFPMIHTGCAISPSLITTYDLTCLMVASIDGNIQSIKDLLVEGEDINFKNKLGFTCLMVASHCLFNTETVKLLLENGADPFIKDQKGKYALDFCVTENCKKLITKAMSQIQ